MTMPANLLVVTQDLLLISLLKLQPDATITDDPKSVAYAVPPDFVVRLGGGVACVHLPLCNHHPL